MIFLYFSSLDNLPIETSTFNASFKNKPKLFYQTYYGIYLITEIKHTKNTIAEVKLNLSN